MNSFTYTIPSREDILGILRSHKQSLSADEVANLLNVGERERDGFNKRLTAMERDGQLTPDRKGKYQVVAADSFISGKVQGHRDGYGFLICDDGQEDIYLNNREMQKVMHNDKVLVRVVGTDRRGRPEGHIVEVVDRANVRVIGRLINEKGVLLVAPEDKRMGHDIQIPQGATNGAKVGQVVSVELTEPPTRFTQPVGQVVEILGEIDDPGMEIEIAVRKYGVPYQFPESALKQAAKLPDTVQARDRKNRVDLRDIALVTIDGEDARDFDDAVYCEPVQYGRKKTEVGYRLIVAIADVSHYVQPNDALDNEALNRSTSVYFPRRVIPMLPEKLSNGLCSLNPNVDRLCLVCDAVITADGEIHAYQFYPAVMHSAARFTYTEVATILGNTKGPEAARRSTLVPHLQNLYALYKTLEQARGRRGAIDFETTETYIVCDAQGKIEQILPRTRNDAHKLIEECMLAANVCAADFMAQAEHPGLYRIHAHPNEDKLTNVRAFLKTVGMHLGGGDKPHASDYAAVMAKIKGRPDAALLQTMMLRSMQQAVYSPDNVGHFGLAYEAYGHFTSPIRRYPDLLTHRVIKALLHGKRYDPKPSDTVELNTMLAPKARKLQAEDVKKNGPRKRKSHDAIWDELGLHCSANERRADEASRDVEAWLKCYFMRNHLGEEYSGTISGVAPFGIFVQLDTLFIEGMIHVTELGADYFQYDEARNELRGERTGIRYQLTGRVTVQVSRVDLDARKIDFTLVNEPAIKAMARGKQPPAAKAVAATGKPPGGVSMMQSGDPRRAVPGKSGKAPRSSKSAGGQTGGKTAGNASTKTTLAHGAGKAGPAPSRKKSASKTRATTKRVHKSRV
ncbi:ribonuclease R [Ampullimonas aquatilis]|uniref:ribonuclease R n=1 Tax=Ampullimonas aquatilis TaxID=1341549 RepID=UPI003C7460F2